MKNILRVLVPIDFSKESEFALEWAQVVARGKTATTVYLLHVMPLESKPEHSGMASTAYGLESEEIQQKMAQIQARLPQDLLSFPVYETGRVPEAIARVCGEKNIDLVIITTRGRRGVTHLFEGSTTEETVRLAPCPVFVLHLNPKTRAELSGQRVQP